MYNIEFSQTVGDQIFHYSQIYPQSYETAAITCDGVCIKLIWATPQENYRFNCYLVVNENGVPDNDIAKMYYKFDNFEYADEENHLVLVPDGSFLTLLDPECLFEVSIREIMTMLMKSLHRDIVTRHYRHTASELMWLE